MQVELVKYNPEEHFDYMSCLNEGGTEIKSSHLIKGVAHVFALNVSGVKLIFKDLSQLERAKDFFEKKIRPETNGGGTPHEHFWHVWYGRLPRKVLKASNREKIFKALNTALEKYRETCSL